eukprot:SAG31_NODE_1556_length_7893_cov_1.993585_10_plen_62_part_00
MSPATDARHEAKGDYEDRLRLWLDVVHKLQFGSIVVFVLQGGSYTSRTKQLGWSEPMTMQI